MRLLSVELCEQRMEEVEVKDEDVRHLAIPLLGLPSLRAGIPFGDAVTQVLARRTR